MDWPVSYKLRLMRRLREEFGVQRVLQAPPGAIEYILLDDVRSGNGPRWPVQELRALDYRTGYLLHPWWRLTRKRKLAETNGRCERCGDRAKEIHHRTYDRLGEELMEDLEALCQSCHRDQHLEIPGLDIKDMFRMPRG